MSSPCFWHLNFQAWPGAACRCHTEGSAATFPHFLTLSSFLRLLSNAPLKVFRVFTVQCLYEIIELYAMFDGVVKDLDKMPGWIYN